MYYLKLATGPIITLSASSLSPTNTIPTSTSSVGSEATAVTTTSSSSSSSISSSSTGATIGASMTTQTSSGSTLSIASGSTTITTTTAVTKPSATFVRKAPLLNAIKPSTGGGGSSSKLKTQISVVTHQSSPPVKLSASKRSSSLSTDGATNEINVIKLETSSPTPSGANGGSLANSGNGNGTAAAARLIDLGKRLLEATREGQVDSVRQLIVDSGAPFTSDWLGTTALHVAAQNGFVEIAELLLTGGVNRDAKTKLDRTALHLAAQSGSIGIVDLLITSGADVNARDMLKMTPLHWAVERGHVIVARRLLAAGSELNMKNKFQLTPVQIARNSEHYEMLKLFENWSQSTGEAASGLYSQSSTGMAVVNAANFFGPPVTTSQGSRINFDQLFGFGTTNASMGHDDSVPMTQFMSAASKTNLCKSQQRHMSMWATQTNQLDESHDFLDSYDHYHQSTPMGNSDNAGEAAGQRAPERDSGLNSSSPMASGSSVYSPAEDKACIDLVELEWNNLDFVPELFLPSNESDDSESNVEYLMKVVEELQKENKQLRQQVEQLSTTSP